MTKNYFRVCSSSLTVVEMKIKKTFRFHLTSFRMVIIKETTDNMCWKGCGETRPHSLLMGL